MKLTEHFCCISTVNINGACVCICLSRCWLQVQCTVQTFTNFYCPQRAYCLEFRQLSPSITNIYWGFYRLLQMFYRTSTGFPVAQMVEHGASNAKIMGSIPRQSKSWSNVKTVTWMQCKSLWIKASAKCINVNVNVCTNFELISSEACTSHLPLDVNWV